MNRWIWLVCGIVLLMSPGALVAQRRGGHTAGTARPSAGTPSIDDLRDFKRAVALQATPEQVTQFQQLSKSTLATRKSAQDLLQIAEGANKLDLFHSANPLTTAVDEAETDSEKFLQSLSAGQKSGLKNVTRKLKKANSDVTKQNKALTKGLRPTEIDGKKISTVAQELDKALSDLQTKQLAVATEMGIQGGEESSQ